MLHMRALAWAPDVVADGIILSRWNAAQQQHL